MTTASSSAVPNHHAAHPGFSGILGYAAALSMVFGRDDDAALAARLAGLQPGDTVVDIGSGPGAAARWATRRGARVIPVEPATVMRRVARLRGVRARDGVAEALPVADGEATVAWSIATVHHWRDIAAGVAEVWRVLGPGGRFVALERRVAHDATGLGSHGWTRPQAESFGDACRAAGFVDVEVGEHDAGRRGRALAVVAARPSR